MTIDEIEFLIKENSNEREISVVLKRELSILGEYFAPYQIRNEYIAFSEFQIGDSTTDFAVFTSRSRMEIFLIEIKGANFEFITKSGKVSDGDSA